MNDLKYICWEIEVNWCKFEETVEVFVSIPNVHFYVICYMELLWVYTTLVHILLWYIPINKFGCNFKLSYSFYLSSSIHFISFCINWEMVQFDLIMRF